MDKSFTVLKSNVGTMVMDSSSAMATNIGVWVNNRYRDVVSRYEWEDLFFNMSITSTATVSAMPLDWDVDRILFVLDATNNDYLVQDSEQQFFQERYDTFDDTGTPERFFLKYDVVRAQPASAEKITAKSSSASDTTQSILLRSIVSGSEIYETLTLNGTTVVTASAANTSTRILGISKSAVTTGTVSVYHNDQSTVLATLPPETLESRYLQMHVHPIPTGTLVYHIKAKRRVTDLAQAYDYPIIRDISDVIEAGAVADAWRYKRQFGKARDFEYIFEKKLSEKIFQRESQPGLMHQFTPTVLNRNDGIL